MKRFVLTLLAIILIAGVLAGVGFAGYRYGFQQGALAASNSDTVLPPFARGDDFGWKRMPMHGFGPGMPRNFERGWGPGNFGMVGRGGGFGIFPVFGLLIQLAILGFIVWLVYKLFTGWRISLTPRSVPEGPRVEPAQPVESESKNDETTG
ncbi:MAG TPA: hypothetical protein VFR47_03865 [Anaerolineales bacterium]|nr:hypothetical protein [Anaerolineales bacterium]